MDVINSTVPDKYLIVYHREDNDGLFSMALLYQHLVRTMKVPVDNIELFGANYDELSKVNVNDWLKKYQHIMMTDVSLPIDSMKKIFKKLESSFVWIDHHMNIINECNMEGLSVIPGSRETTMSAIMNAYDYLFNPFHLSYDDPDNNIRKPELLFCISVFDSATYDIWGYDKNYVTNINEGINIELNLNPDDIIRYVDVYVNGFDSDSQFYEFNDREIKRFLSIGAEYNKAYNQKVAQYINDYGDEFKVGNRTACGIVSVEMKGSDTFASVKDKYSNGIIFKRLKNGRWVISLYNTDYSDTSFNCGEYLKKKYGGGGHPGAAGCQVDEETVFKILKSKKL